MKSRTKKRLVALGAVLVIAAGGAVALKQLRARNRADLVAQARERGMAAYDAGQWQEAMDSLSYYVSKGGRRDATVFYRMADAQTHVPAPDFSHLGKVISLLRDCLAEDPDDSTARRLLLETYAKAHMFPEAIEAANLLLKTSQDDRDLLTQRVALLAAAGRRQEAIAAAKAVAERFPADPESHRMVIEVIRTQSDAPVPALNDYIESLPRRIDGLDLQILLSSVLPSVDRWEDALRALNNAAEAESMTARQLADFLDAADSLAMSDPRQPPRPNDPPRLEPLEIASSVTDRLDDAAPLDTQAAGVLIARCWRMLLDPRIELRLGAEALDDPTRLDDATLGWVYVIGTNLAETRRTTLLAQINLRTGPYAEFWQAVAHAVALNIRTPEALEAFRLASDAADRLPLRAARERALALYLLGMAKQAALGGDGGDELEQVSYAPGWRIARAQFLQQLLARGDYQRAIGALGTFRSMVNTPAGRLLALEALVGLAEADRAMRSAAQQALADITDLRVKNPQIPGLQALSARARAILGQTDAARADVDALISEPAAAGVDLLVHTASALRPRLPEQATRLLDAAAEVAPDHPSVLVARALALEAQGRRDQALSMFDAAISRADDSHRMAIRIARALFLDSPQVHAGAAAVEDIRRLAREADSLDAQLAVLSSDAAWTDEQLVSAAIGRVEALAGASSPRWRLAEARRLLTFTPDQERASMALGEVLPPLLSAGTDAEAFWWASVAWGILNNREQEIANLDRARALAANPTSIYPRLIGLLAQAGRTSEARDRLTEFVNLGPIGAEPARARARLLESFAMWDRAVDERERLKDTGDQADLVALAACYENAGRADDARQMFEDLAARADATPDTLLNAANYFGSRGQVDRGRDLLTSLRGKVDDNRLAVLLGSYLRAFSTDPAQGASHVLAFARDHRADADAAVWIWLAQDASTRGQVEEARTYIRDGLAAHPDSPPLLAMQRVAQENGANAAALAALAGYASDPSASAESRELGDAVSAFAAGKLDQAALTSRIQKITSDHPTALAAWTLLVRLQVMADQQGQAAASATQAMRVIPGDPRAAQLATETLELLGRDDDALDAARQWRDRAPRNPMPADIAIARLHLRGGRVADADAVLRDWRDALLADPGVRPEHAATLAWSTALSGTPAHRTALLARAASQDVWAAACIDAGSAIADTGAARAWLDEVGALPGLSDDNALRLASTWLALSDRSDDRADAQSALAALEGHAAPPDHPAAAVLLRARAYERLERVDDALRTYRDAAAADPTDLSVAAAAAEAMLSAGRADEALTFATTLQSGSNDADHTPEQRAVALDLVARCKAAIGDTSGAVRALDAALALIPLDPPLLTRKAEILLTSGDREGAASALALIPPSARPADLIIVLAQRLGDARPQDIEWLYRQALARDASNYFALNNLAYHLLTHAGDPAEAVKFADQAATYAIARDPSWTGLGSIQETLGMAYLAAGNAPKAADAFRLGLRYAPASPDLLLGLAESQERQGEHDQARQTLTRIDDATRAALSSEQKVRYDRLATALDR